MYSKEELWHLKVLRDRLLEQPSRALYFNDGTLKPDVDAFLGAAVTNWYELLNGYSEKMKWFLEANNLTSELVRLRTENTERVTVLENRLLEKDNLLQETSKTLAAVLSKRDSVIEDHAALRHDHNLVKDAAKTFLDKLEHAESEVAVLKEKLKSVTEVAMAKSSELVELRSKVPA